MATPFVERIHSACLSHCLSGEGRVRGIRVTPWSFRRVLRSCFREQSEGSSSRVIPFASASDPSGIAGMLLCGLGVIAHQYHTVLTGRSVETVASGQPTTGGFDLLALGLVATFFHSILVDRLRLGSFPDVRQQAVVIRASGQQLVQHFLDVDADVGRNSRQSQVLHGCRKDTRGDNELPHAKGGRARGERRDPDWPSTTQTPSSAG